MPTKPSTFRPPHLPSPTQQRAAYERWRGSARDRGYTTAWDKAAKAYRQANPLCLGCQAVGRVVPTAVVDHVVPHEGDAELFWDEGNWQPACSWHHDEVKQRLEGMWKAGRATAADLRLDSPLAQRLTRGG